MQIQKLTSELSVNLVKKSKISELNNTLKINGINVRIEFILFVFLLTFSFVLHVSHFNL